MFRRSPRALVLWAAALLVAVVTAAIVASDLATLHRRATDFGPERGAVVARRDLRLGTRVDAADLAVRPVHRSQLPPGVVETRDRAVGRVVVVPVLRSGFVTTRNLAPHRRRGLDGALPPGSRAMRVVATDAVRPRPGAAVDVLASFDAATDIGDIGDDDVTAPVAVVASGVVVLAVDDTRTTEGGAGLGVTLLVSPREARELALAATHGVITLALVPPEDARPF